jgi:hypothetical protein
MKPVHGASYLFLCTASFLNCAVAGLNLFRVPGVLYGHGDLGVDFGSKQPCL